MRQIIRYAPPGQEDIMSHQEYCLLRRGWALQERLLSHRFLSFRFDRMQWECNTCCYSDDLECPFTIDFDHTSQAKKRSMRGLKDATGIFSYWREIIETYSDCKLSERTDKLPALSGLAHAFSTILHDTYVAGIWRNDIHHGLSWSVSSSNKELNSSRIVEESPLAYRAPSWSWASTDSCIFFHRYFQCQPYNDLVIISIDTRTQGLDAFGQVMCGTLHVSGRLRKGIVQGANERQSTGFNVGSAHEQNSSVGTLYPDHVQLIKRLQGVERGQKSVMALLISYSTDDGGTWVALALEQIAGEGKDLIFQRIGLIKNKESDMEGNDWFEHSERKAVRIV